MHAVGPNILRGISATGNYPQGDNDTAVTELLRRLPFSTATMTPVHATRASAVGAGRPWLLMLFRPEEQFALFSSHGIGGALFVSVYEPSDPDHGRAMVRVTVPTGDTADLAHQASLHCLCTPCAAGRGSRYGNTSPVRGVPRATRAACGEFSVGRQVVTLASLCGAGHTWCRPRSPCISPVSWSLPSTLGDESGFLPLS